jgi:hypothetical protein
MKLSLLRCMPRSRKLWALTLLCACAPAFLVAQPVQIQPTGIPAITSTADRMISYRNQQHSWQTPDGALHLMVNLGNTPTGASLALYSSFDGGNTWTQMLTLANTDAFSTSDGMLATIGSTGTSLLLVYASAQTTGTILFASVAYNSAAQSWTIGSNQTVFAASGILASNPALATDSTGIYWCGFTAESLASGLYQERMTYRPARTAQWFDTGLVFGSTDSSLQHSARPVPYAGGIGMVFESDQTMYWAYRLNGWPASTPWVTSTLYSNLPPYSEDPYDTHYSVQSDAMGNLHLAFVANQQLLYMRMMSSTGNWGPPRILTPNNINAAYVQVVMSAGNVVLMVNYQQSIEVQQSADGGNTWALTQMLVHPAPPPNSPLYYGNPRMESPGRVTSPIPVLQQFVDGPTQELMFFQVPVISPVTPR